MKDQLYEEYINRLIKVNDETKTDLEHALLLAEFRGWVQGINAAGGHFFNGDHYYIEKFNTGEIGERPLCCGVFLNWKSKVA